eukprot:Colp12_sorted_trinity150504_noHs@8513
MSRRLVICFKRMWSRKEPRYELVHVVSSNQSSRLSVASEDTMPSPRDSRSAFKKAHVLYAVVVVALLGLNIYNTITIAQLQNNQAHSKLVQASSAASSQSLLHMSVDSPYLIPFSVPFDESMTSEDLHKAVAEKLGVPHQYVVLYKGADAAIQRDSLKSTHSLRNQTLPLMVRSINRHPSNMLGRSQTSKLTENGINPSNTMNVLLRPLKGDHIHYIFEIYVKGKKLAKLYDRPVQQQVYEGKHLEQLFPHVGLHAGRPEWFDDSCIHVHPGTAWQWFRHTEGLGANLGAYLVSQMRRLCCFCIIIALTFGAERISFQYPIPLMSEFNYHLEFPAIILASVFMRV